MGEVVAIDGPSGAGKSTVTRLLAEKLGYRLLDTGALYRAVGLGLRSKGLGQDASDTEIKEALKNIDVEFTEGRAYLNGRDVSGEIRTPEAGHYSSVFSARPPVRQFLLPVQRDAALRDNLVAEGRDMTTVVFPEARWKFYLDASDSKRAVRRCEQLRQSGMEISLQEARKEVISRDQRDSGRKDAPLMKAPDAVVIDSTEMSIGEVLETMLEVIGGGAKGDIHGVDKK